MEPAKLQELAQGKIYTGRQAVAKGLADKLGTLEVAVTEAKVAAGMPADEKVEILNLPKPKSFLDQLLEGPSVESKLQSVAPELAALARKGAELRALFARPCATVLPFEVRFR
jgi:protease-4